MSATHAFLATCPRELAPLLAEELRGLGAVLREETAAAVAFDGALELAYRACLWSRVASRVLLSLGRFPAPTAAALYEGVHAIDWTAHLAPEHTLAVSCVLSRRAPGFSSNIFAALKTKDAIVDHLREKTGRRPSVDRDHPDLRVQLRLGAEEAEVCLDLAGESLHRRHYRERAERPGEGDAAPLKENLAAGLLLLAGWPQAAREGRPLLDPMCGSGTLPLEAGLIAADLAPGLLRPELGSAGWRGHQPELWRRALEEARERAARRPRHLPAIVGTDADGNAVRLAQASVERAGLRRVVHIERRALWDSVPPGGRTDGLLVVNPPYGHRLGETEALLPLYTGLGDLLKRRFTGWTAHLLSGNRELTRAIGLRPTRRQVVYNGPLECRLLRYPILAGEGPGRQRQAPTADAADRDLRTDGDTAAGVEDEARPTDGDTVAVVDHERPPTGAAVDPPEAPDETTDGEPDGQQGVAMFANRLRKNRRRLGRWARRSGITCYRLYDADLPEFAVAVDCYGPWAHVQEYAPPPTVDPASARRRLRQVISVLPEVLELSPGDVFLKVRRRQRHGTQYGRLRTTGQLREVQEGNHRFLINLTDYLDTGLFLDQRLTRALIGELAPGRRFLNLFCYTGTATICAARGGATSSLSVDLSATYLDWARRNFQLNGLAPGRHPLERADCLEWIKQTPGRFDLIFLDPPTFSKSKAMKGTLDIQRDHPWLLRATLHLLERGGILLFSTNHSRFKLEREALAGLAVEDLSRATLPQDFARRPRLHHLWKITRP